MSACQNAEIEHFKTMLKCADERTETEHPKLAVRSGRAKERYRTHAQLGPCNYRSARELLGFDRGLGTRAFSLIQRRAEVGFARS